MITRSPALKSLHWRPSLTVPATRAQYVGGVTECALDDFQSGLHTRRTHFIKTYIVHIRPFEIFDLKGWRARRSAAFMKLLVFSASIVAFTLLPNFCSSGGDPDENR